MRIRSRPIAAAIVLVVAGSVAPACGGDRASGTITVAAASNLRPAFEELGATLTEQTGVDVTFSFASSGQLQEQIVNGAPFDLFASADESYVEEVIRSGHGIAETRAHYADGLLALWSPAGVPRPSSVSELAGDAYRRIAIANPTHAPYGVAAREALVAAGIHDRVAGRLVYGENIADTFRIARSGNADVGIVALSLVIAEGGAHTIVPAELHGPLRQVLVVTSSGERGRDARRFARLVTSAEGQAVLRRYGFTTPTERGSD